MDNEKDISLIDEKIYYTYHSKKNKEALPKIIFFSILFIFFNGALYYELILWCWYGYYCMNNNYELNHDKKNLKDRQLWIQLKQEKLNK